jgi:hypothetical protein
MSSRENISSLILIRKMNRNERITCPAVDRPKVDRGYRQFLLLEVSLGLVIVGGQQHC